MSRPPCQHERPPGSERCPICDAAAQAAAAVPSGPSAASEAATLYIPDEPEVAAAAPAGGEAATVFIPEDKAETIHNSDTRIQNFSRTSGGGSGSTNLQQRVNSWQSLSPGEYIAARYEIIKMLGEGGMGAVYKAVDHELGREVAIKLIRPELASQSDILDRFKQEVVLARQITHHNVVRIYDLGSDGPLKFLTMEYMIGEELQQYIARTKPGIIEIAAIFRQICEGLVAAHSTDVVHRDLKPANVMITPDGRAAVMDFGLALAVEKKGAVKSGGIMGTPDYMSPEQAQGKTVDQRSDIFSLGLILYEMLTSTLPYKGDTLLDVLAARTLKPAQPPIEVNPGIPPALNALVCKMLEIRPEDRYQTVTEVLEALDAWEVHVPGSRASQRHAKARAQAEAALQGRLRRGYWLVGVAAALMLAAGGYFFWQSGRPKGPQTPVKLLIADFENNSGEQVFDRTLEPLFSVALEGASFITAMNREQARRLGKELQPASTKFDEDLARLVAVRQGFDVVLSGTIDHSSDGFSLSTRALDAVTGKLLAASKETVQTKEEVLSSVRKLAAPVRRSLGDATSESAQMIAAETYTAGSMEAAHSYAVGQEHQLAGKFEDALRYYQMAVQLDPSFGRAYAGIAVVERNLGRRQKAEENYKMALERIERMSERERYRTRGGYYVTIGQPEKAVQEFQALVKKYPSDTAGHANLAVAYLNLREMQKALEEGRKAIEIYPKNVGQRNNVAMFALYAGNYSMAMREAQEALKLNPAYVKAFVALALGQLASGHADQATATYGKLQALSPLGASLAVSGLADIALLEGRTADAIRDLTKGITADEAAPATAPRAASKRVLLSFAHLTEGDLKRAATVAERAASGSTDDDIQMMAGIVLARAGQSAKALAIAEKLEQLPEPRRQSRGLIVRAEVLVQQKEYTKAAPLLQQSIGQLDLWSAHYTMGLAHLGFGDFAKAEQEFQLCLKRGGETTSLLIDEVPTHFLLPPVYYQLGVAAEGAKNAAAAKENFAKFVAIRKQGSDAMWKHASAGSKAQ